MEKKYIVITKDLTKKYNGKAVVNKLNLRIAEGDAFGLLGHPGAGKTTAILMLLGLTKPSSGDALVCGYNPAIETVKVKRLVGYLPEQSGFYNNLTARQNLEYIAEINRVPYKGIDKDINEVLEAVGIRNLADEKVGKFSTSMKRLLAIADALIKKPGLVILDEPLTGLDPDGKERITELITRLPELGTTVILASHQLYQMQKLCTRIGIISDGKIVVEGSVEYLGLQQSEGRYRIEIETKGPTPQLLTRIRDVKGVIDVETRENHLMLTTKADVRSELSRIMALSNLPLLQMKITQFNLNDIYNKYFRDKEH